MELSNSVMVNQSAPESNLNSSWKTSKVTGIDNPKSQEKE